MNNLPLTRDLVLIGGGHTHALVLRKWGMNPLAGVRVTLINPGPTAPYTGMLPGFVAGHYTRDELDIDLVKLARFAGARLIDGAVTAIDRERKLITVSGRPPIAYDVCAMDIGVTSGMPSLRGYCDHGVGAKPLGAFSHRWAAFLQSERPAEIAVIGGGVAGAELSMAMRFALYAAGKAPKIHLIDRGQILANLGRRARKHLSSELSHNQITVVENTTVAEVTESTVVLANGVTIPSWFTVGATGARPYDWLSDIGVAMHRGFIAVDAHLRSDDPSIFAVGDCAELTMSPRPKAGVFAVREAPYLFDNLRAVLTGGTLRKFKPQADYLKLASLGGKRALAEKFGFSIRGPLLWRWKDQIDRKFMDQFVALPDMAAISLPTEHALGMKEALGDKPMCGGCGAKVGRGALQDTLSMLPASDRNDVQVIAGDDAGMIVFGKVKQVMSTDHLRSFTHDPVIMTKIAAIHALGDIWAMGAKPQAVTVSVTLPRMSPDLQRRTMAEVMSAAHAVISDAGAAIVGGHSSLGDEFTIGFTATGVCDGDPITLGGAKVGDTIILTKPIGSGVIMAAEMAQKAHGHDVLGALITMTQGQGAASEILSNAHAMTDVTGFGLAGHLSGICDASGVGVDLNLAKIPMMSGAKPLSVAGVRSSLFDENVSGSGLFSQLLGPETELLFDPQTAGGLLATVASKDAEKLLSALRSAGCTQAAAIGRVTAKGVSIS